jgi:hypothetical protein
VNHYVCANSNGEKIFHSVNESITLAHELIHAFHYFEESLELFFQKINSKKNIIDPELDNLEEQETIIGKEGEGTLCENVFRFHFGYPLRVNHQGAIDPFTASDCAALGTLGNLKGMLSSNPSLLNLPQQVSGPGNIERTLLNTSIVLKKMEIVDYLFQAGVDINAQDAQFGTALHVAVQTNQLDLVKLLLEKGANPDLRGPKGTALQLALRQKNDEIIEILAPVTNLKQEIGGNFLLHSEFDNASPEGIRALIRHGADINSKNISGNTPLMHCCDSDHYKIIKETKLKFAVLLHQENIDLEAKNIM